MKEEKAQPALVGVVVVTHGSVAPALLTAACSIVGDIPAVTTVCAEEGEGFASIVQQIARACDLVDDGAGVLLITDVHGSTPFHASMSMLDGTRPAEVLCGVNLPMLIKLTTVNRRQVPPTTLAEELRDSGRRSIRLGTELTGQVVVGSTA
jgi:PTS system mannose-specific IIA component